MLTRRALLKNSKDAFLHCYSSFFIDLFGLSDNLFFIVICFRVQCSYPLTPILAQLRLVLKFSSIFVC